ncbi:hypothetical protein LCGC14_0652230 [marine sediment metagenome]|uniref:Uncharacterized protein n=1 Tax=marine sediment metagenome TaxID=412755 RepID=A0A0F9QVZ7_9ZZZZ
MKLNTLKDFDTVARTKVTEYSEGYSNGYNALLSNLKVEGIKWFKELKFDEEEGVWNIWKEFFNITKRDLK